MYTLFNNTTDYMCYNQTEYLKLVIVVRNENNSPDLFKRQSLHLNINTAIAQVSNFSARYMNKEHVRIIHQHSECKPKSKTNTVTAEGQPK